LFAGPLYGRLEAGEDSIGRSCLYVVGCDVVFEAEKESPTCRYGFEDLCIFDAFVGVGCIDVSKCIPQVSEGADKCPKRARGGIAW
jgi:hypothetical protein